MYCSPPFGKSSPRPPEGRVTVRSGFDRVYVLAASSSGDAFEATSPSSGEIIAVLPRGTRDDARAAAPAFEVTSVTVLPAEEEPAESTAADLRAAGNFVPVLMLTARGNAQDGTV